MFLGSVDKYGELPSAFGNQSDIHLSISSLSDDLPFSSSVGVGKNIDKLTRRENHFSAPAPLNCTLKKLSIGELERHPDGGIVARKDRGVGCLYVLAMED
jgi:hypothetical protein